MDFNLMKNYQSLLTKKATCKLVDLIKDKSQEILLIRQELYNRQ